MLLPHQSLKRGICLSFKALRFSFLALHKGREEATGRQGDRRKAAALFAQCRNRFHGCMVGLFPWLPEDLMHPYPALGKSICSYGASEQVCSLLRTESTERAVESCVHVILHPF